MFRFTTRNSIYEVDPDGKRIRRVECHEDHYDHRLSDGKWHEYHELVGVEIDSITPMVVLKDGGGVHFSRITSVGLPLVPNEEVDHHTTDPTPRAVLELIEEARS